MAFGALSDDILKELNVELLDTLCGNCIAKGKESDDADTRKQAIKSLVSVVERISLPLIDPAQLVDIVEVMFSALKDYAVDRRGDVGSWVREQAMIGLTGLVTLVLEPVHIE